MGKSSPTSAKGHLRRWAATLTPASSLESGLISRAGLELLNRRRAVRVLSFLSMPGEVDLSLLHSQTGFEFHVTRTPPRGGLTVHRLTEDLVQHPFGYLQPPATAPPVEISSMELVLVPGVLFDRHGGRLGHGKGYYDRLLDASEPRPYLVGVTLERRVIGQIPMDSTDVAMDGVLTEEGFRPRSNP